MSKQHVNKATFKSGKEQPEEINIETICYLSKAKKKIKQILLKIFFKRERFEK